MYRGIGRLLVCVAALVLLMPSALGAEVAAEPGTQPTVRYAVLNVSGALPESLPPIYLFEREGDTLHGLLGRIDRARRDGRVSGVILRLRGYTGGWAKAQELREALAECRAGGKDVICLLESADNLDYYVATAAGRIVMLPTGWLFLSGLRAESIFAGELLDKVGIEPQLVQVGKYKGAADPMTRTDYSQPFRAALQAVLDSYYSQLREGLTEGRGLPISRAEVLFRRGPFSARAAREADLVDDVMFYDQLLAELRRQREGRLVVEVGYGRPEPKSPFQAGQFNLLQMLMGGRTPTRRAPSGPTIAAIHATGPIVMESDDELPLGEQIVGARRLVRTIRRAAEDSSVKAIVLRVDSPGGSAMASDLIWHALRQADEVKPVIASFSDTAASGGYYIGAGARAIVAEPGTLTGSIGVLGGKLVLTELLGKLGLTVDVVESGPGAGMLSPFREFSADERGRVEKMMREIYETFIERVAETRPGMAYRDVEMVAEGRIWTGRQAHENGLVDHLGGLDEAVAVAREAAGIAPEEEIRVVHLPRPRNLAEVLFFGPGEEVAVPQQLTAELLRHLPRVRSYLGALLAVRDEMAVCLMPAIVTIR